MNKGKANPKTAKRRQARRIAVPTKGSEGLKDVVSEVFGRANTFTIIDAEKGKIKSVEILENPAISYRHGAGPIVVKMLVDAGVNIILATELGPGALAILEQHNIAAITVQPDISVKDSIEKVLHKVET